MKRLAYGVLAVILLGCASQPFKNRVAPEHFEVRFDTSKGPFELKVVRQASPEAADRFYSLVKSGYFDGSLAYRTHPNFVVQFGGHNAQEVAGWEKAPIPDEPVRQSNTKGTLSFARGGKNSRSGDVFLRSCPYRFRSLSDKAVRPCSIDRGLRVNRQVRPKQSRFLVPVFHIRVLKVQAGLA